MSDDVLPLEEELAPARLERLEMEPRPLPTAMVRADGWLREYELMARDVARSIVLPKSIREDPRAILAVALTGRELGLGFMESCRLIDVINEVPALRAELKVRLARRTGYLIEVVERTRRMVRLRGTRPDGQVHEVEWAIDQADATTPEAVIASEIMIEQWEGPRDSRRKVAKPLVSKDNWQYSSAMLWARCVSQLLRENPPDESGVAGMYSVEELKGVEADG